MLGQQDIDPVDIATGFITDAEERTDWVFECDGCEHGEHDANCWEGRQA